MINRPSEKTGPVQVRGHSLYTIYPIVGGHTWPLDRVLRRASKGCIQDTLSSRAALGLPAA